MIRTAIAVGGRANPVDPVEILRAADGDLLALPGGELAVDAHRGVDDHVHTGELVGVAIGVSVETQYISSNAAQMAV